MLRIVTSFLSPGGTRGRLSAFIFHRVLAAPDPLLPGEPDAAQFDRMLDWIGGQFAVLPPLEACERLQKRSLPPRAAIITFDDGYGDNHEVALPILQRHRMPAAFFVATGFLNGGAMFNDRVIEAVRGARLGQLDARWLGAGEIALGDDAQRRDALARLLPAVKYLPLAQRLDAVERLEQACGARARPAPMMTDAQVRELHAAGMEIGGHTRNHPILRLLDDRDAAAEIGGGRDDLAAIIGQAPALFAYPNGRPGDDFDARHWAIVKEAGFRFAFTTVAGASTGSDAPFMLRRHTPWARTALRFRAQALRNLLGRD